MTPAQRLLPLALALLTIAMQPAHAAGAGSREPYPATPGAAGSVMPLTAQYAWRGAGYLDAGGRQAPGAATALKLHAGDGRTAGLSRKLEGGWALSGSYSRDLGAAGSGAYERGAGAMPRADLRPLPGRGQRGAVVMTLSRRF